MNVSNPQQTSLPLSIETTNFYAHLIGIKLDCASIPLLRQIYRQALHDRLNIPQGISKEQFLKETEILAIALKSALSISLNPIPHALASGRVEGGYYTSPLSVRSQRASFLALRSRIPLIFPTFAHVDVMVTASMDGK